MGLLWRGGILELSGDLDLSSVDLLRDAVDAAKAHGSHLVVDMTAVTFIDSSAIQACFVHAFRSGLSVVVMRPSRIVRRVLDLTGITELVTIED